MIGFTNAGGGKSVGGKLTVTAPANTDVTVKLGSKSKVQNSGSGGIAVFKDLDQGNWDISIANSEQAATVPATITTDYSMDIAFFASKIAVTYPSRSTCTCTNGGTTYTAPDTTGSYTFTVPRTGTWTVKIANGSSTKTQDVSITSNGQSVSITLNYWNGELFDNGNQYTDYTGGWGIYGGAYTDTKLHGGGTNVTAAVYTKNKVDVTKFSKLCFTGSFVHYLGGNVGFGLMDHYFTWDSITYVAGMRGSSSSDGSGGMSNGTVDISGVSGSYYITMHSVNDQGASFDVSKVWME